MTFRYDLSGEWEFKLDNEMQGLDAHFESQSFSDHMELPGTTAFAKKGAPNPEAKIDALTEEFKTEGYAWFRRVISIDPACVGQRAFLFLERTRISHVWVDGVYVGSKNSLCTAHQYELTEFIRTPAPVITIMTSNTGYPTRGGHMTSPDTQTNWNGIVGRMTLSFYHTMRIDSVRTEVDYDKRKLSLHILADAAADIRQAALSVKASAVTLNEQALNEHRALLSSVPANGTLAAPAKPVLQNPASVIKEDTPISLADATPVSIKSGQHTLTYTYELPDNLPDWDEYDPSVIRLTVTLADSEETESVETWFGIRKLEANGTHFYINGRKTFLRGKHDGMIFPLTGFAPMHLEGWLQSLLAAKAFGINHYRCHTCCPPEAAFLAADLLGIYYEPELPFWGTFAAEGEDGYDKESQEYLTEEGFRILDEFGNHPSFCMMSMGNELWGSPEAVNELVGRYKAHDDRHLYTQGSNNFQWVPNIQSNDDFFCGVRFTVDRQIRGSYAMCDAPQGHVQTDRPCTDFNYEEAIFPPYNSKAAEVSEDGTVEIQYGTGVKRVKLTEAAAELIPNIPVVSHEIGQYETYPDFDEINKYTGVLKARNFEIFRERLDKKGLLPLAKDYFRASGALAAACYKDELETALRTKDMAGFQILDIQDFSGQGTALVGMLDAFMENKGILDAAQWRSFCSDAVIQAEFPGYVLSNGSTLEGTLSLTWYRKMLPDSLDVEMKLSDITDRDSIANPAVTAIQNLHFDQPLHENGYHRLSGFSIAIPAAETPRRYQLDISVSGSDIHNSYELWAYPVTDNTALADPTYSDYVTSDFVQAIKRTQAGAAVVLCLKPEQNPNSVPGTYATDFWCYPMFRSISESMKKPWPIGTMGLLIQNDHPALGDFPCDGHSTPQWWDIVMRSASTILDDTQIAPIVRTIDNFERNHSLGLIYEVRIAGAKAPIILCTSPLQELIAEGHTEAAWLLHSLCRYAERVNDCPHEIVTMTEGEFYGLFAPRA